ncbi:MAG: acyltransferase, partial [Bacteroidales bacterium]|nr:acyltransferase [Bacteroidales bacterium]
INIYKRSILSGVNFFFGKIENYVILSYLPPSAIREESSLIYMINLLIEKSKNSLSEVIQNKENLTSKIELLNKTDAKTILIALSYSLLDYAETNNIKVYNNIIIMDTGGMKGKRKEIIREELHSKLKYFFGTQTILSEYSMTELLSQAYSKGEGIYSTPPWMKILIRDINDPLASEKNNKTGGINIIDLANINSCSFISTYDLGVRFIDGRFKIFGRFDNSDIRGCSLLTY